MSTKHSPLEHRDRGSERTQGAGQKTDPGYSLGGGYLLLRLVVELRSCRFHQAHLVPLLFASLELVCHRCSRCRGICCWHVSWRTAITCEAIPWSMNAFRFADESCARAAGRRGGIQL